MHPAYAASPDDLSSRVDRSGRVRDARSEAVRELEGDAEGLVSSKAPRTRVGVGPEHNVSKGTNSATLESLPTALPLAVPT